MPRSSPPSPPASRVTETGAPQAADPALWVEWAPGAAGGAPRAAMWRHVDRPFEAEVDASARRGDPARLPSAVFHRLADDYLAALPDSVRPHAAVLAALRGGKGCLRWLDIGWGDPAIAAARHDPQASYWLQRRDGPVVVERSLVLLAARRAHGHAIGDGVGLRIVMHLQPLDGGRFGVRIHGATASRLDGATATAALPAALRQLGGSLAAARQGFGALNRDIARALGVDAAAVQAVSADALAEPGWLRLRGVASRRRQPSTTLPGQPAPPSPRARVYSFVVDVDPSGRLQRQCALDEWRAGAVAAALRVFERDPASCGPAATLAARRPTRDAARLDAFRVGLDERLVTGVPGGPFKLGRAGEFAVWGASRRGEPASTLRLSSATDATVALPRRPRLPLRSDRLAAVQAFIRAAEWFDRLRAWGFEPESYFRQARLPLVLRPRAAMRGAPAGDDVNAEVRPMWPDGIAMDCTPGQARQSGEGAPALLLPQLQVRFGSGGPQVRQSLNTLDGRQRAQYLGLAADPRWAWHEFGHVLSFAATGALELAFAHSAGDALAAIACDPDSALAWDDAARGMTFPWVQVPRRHDRSATEGYGWCGQRNAARRAGGGVASGPHRHGYLEEQLLSSSLFRLYRCLGGDTRASGRAIGESDPVDDADLPARQAAADYGIYLVVRAIALLGPDGIAPARSADQFVSALIDADLGTGCWRVDACWPYRQDRPRAVLRQGGQAHKLVRWAFEQQGLYASDRPLAIVEGIGRPPPVDLFVADLRRTGRPDGGYHPVPLRWQHDPAPWHADPAHLGWDGRAIRLRLGQCGALPADDVRAALWWADANAKAGAPSAGADTPDAPLRWQPLGELGPLALGAAVGGVPDFETLSLTPDGPGANALAQGRPGWLLANAQSDGDRSNWPLDRPPPATGAALMDLVAGDNNLGLRRLP